MNNIKNNACILIIIMYLIILSLFICTNIFICDNSQKIVINLIFVIFVQLLTFYIFKLSFISCVTLLTAMLLWPSLLVYYFKVPQKSLGLVSMHIVPIYMYKDTFYILFFMIIWSFIAYLLNINLYTKRIIKEPLLHINNISIILNNFISIVFSIIAFPSIPKMGTTITESTIGQGLLPGRAWNQLVIVALLFNLPYIKNHISVVLTFLFSVLWFLLHGERADIAGLFLGIFILIMMSKKVNRDTKILVCIIGLFIVLFFIGLRSNDSIFSNMNRIATFSTVSDVSYTFNAIINYISMFGYSHGKLLINMLQSAVPFNHGANDVGTVVGRIIPYPGGGSIVSTPLMDDGLIGVICYTMAYLCIIKFIIIGKSRLCKYEILILVCSIPRVSWYGVHYVFTSMIFFVPFIYFLNKYFSKNKA